MVRRRAAEPSHRDWLRGQAESLFRFFAGSFDPAGGFHLLDYEGHPLPEVRQDLHVTTRMVHSYALAQAMKLPGAAEIVDHGMQYLWDAHRDPRRGGYRWAVGPDGPIDATRQAYGHAFVLLAASSARMVGHPDAARLFDDVTEVILTRFWDEGRGMMAEEFDGDWRPLGPYRGQNSNMHMTEALMAAHEATGDPRWLAMAERIAGFLIDHHARANGWRVPEHFHADWTVDPGYDGDPMFRPRGATPGHALEWARLLIQLWQLGGQRQAWMPEAAQALFATAVADGWNLTGGGLIYTTDHAGRADQRQLYWWPVCEGIGAAAALGEVAGTEDNEHWYRRFWDFAEGRLIDPVHGGWFPQVAPDGRPEAGQFPGKPDIYHAVQACLLPLVPTRQGLLAGLLSGAYR